MNGKPLTEEERRTPLVQLPPDRIDQAFDEIEAEIIEAGPRRKPRAESAE